MDAVILCAGKGKRISKYIDSSQKCMFKINGKPILHNILEGLESIQVNNIYFVVGYKAEDVKDYFSKIVTKAKVYFIEDDRFEVDSTSRSLLLTEPFIDSDFIYSQGEIFYDSSLIKQLFDAEFKDSYSIMAICPDTKVAPTHPRVHISNDRIKSICLYPVEFDNEHDFSYVGAAKIKPEIFNYLKGELRVSDALNAMLKDKKEISYIIYNKKWKHLGTREDMADLI